MDSCGCDCISKKNCLWVAEKFIKKNHVLPNFSEKISEKIRQDKYCYHYLFYIPVGKILIQSIYKIRKI